MSAEMTVVSRAPAVTDIMPIIENMDKLMYLGDVLVKSKLLPEAIRTKESAVAIILKGRELGIGPMEAFSSINVISGKPTISPQLMMALAERSGQLDDCRIVDDGKKCTVTVKRRGRSTYSASFSMDDAKMMKTRDKDGNMIPLADKHNWRQMPKVMRQWRAISAAFRVTFPDVLAGLYIPEELGADVDADGVVVTRRPEQSVISESVTVLDEPAQGAAEEQVAELPDEAAPATQEPAGELPPFFPETPDGETFRKHVHVLKNEIGSLNMKLRALKVGDQDSPEGQAAIAEATNKVYRDTFALYQAENSKDPALDAHKAAGIIDRLKGKRNWLAGKLLEMEAARAEEEAALQREIAQDKGSETPDVPEVTADDAVPDTNNADQVDLGLPLEDDLPF